MKTRVVVALLAGTALFAACSGAGNYEVNNASASTADSIDAVAADSISIPENKLVRTAELRFKVKDVVKSGKDISALTAGYGGMVTHHQMNSDTEGTKDTRLSNDSVMRVTSLSISADMMVKVPSAKLEEYMDKVSAMGVYVSLRRMDIEDKTLDYLSNKLKLSSRKELLDKQKKGKVTIKRPEAVLMLTDDMIDHQIENQRVNDAVKYSVVSLDLYQSNIINKEVIANDDPSAYGLPFSSRFGLAINNGWSVFKEVIIVATNLWVLVVTGLAIWLIIRYARRKYAVTRQAGA
ncbi:DUF4349 domain-containing protein [Mucilaginibacter myungsuensis]|uniref:DUF4349 domain-containing protein n=1 Tax=Mucilaginibacter myungsuensis TaxID=649104 RepID=A0A929L0V0_9SPHI|nr:DUF4349 domain-containing protein [Mucilaginibacter myungsuensis]MBE9664172.1 DUF4349 domain-containing protein [Mucilaginibacter myungsuensis]MDN3599875.1 DUF4349 domain-containing protein [Mucilaginibacter myungsuensis]